MVLIWLKFENKQIKQIKPHFLLNFYSQLSISKKSSILTVIFFYKSHMPALNMPKFPYPACCQCLLVTTTNITHGHVNQPLSRLPRHHHHQFTINDNDNDSVFTLHHHSPRHHHHHQPYGRQHRHVITAPPHHNENGPKRC